MSEHTKEPWIVDDPHQIFAASIGEYVAITNVERDEARLIDSHTVAANARRIVACVNACAGLDTDLLENMQMLGDTIKQRFKVLTESENELQKQRDELLAALVEIAVGGARNTPRNSKCEHGQYSFQPCEQCIEEFARRAIAAAKGGV